MRSPKNPCNTSISNSRKGKNKRRDPDEKVINGNPGCYAGMCSDS
jgi:hypothetical protein